MRIFCGFSDASNKATHEGFEATCSKGPAVQMNRGVPCLRDFRAGALQGSEICMPQRLQRKASTYVACSTQRAKNLVAVVWLAFDLDARG